MFLLTFLIFLVVITIEISCVGILTLVLCALMGIAFSWKFFFILLLIVSIMNVLLK